MDISIKLAPGFFYSAGAREFPLDVEISAEVPTEINSSINVAAALLTKADGSGTSFGFIRRVTPARRQFVALLPQQPVRMRVNVLEHDEDFDAYSPGTYRCDIKVEVEEKFGEGARTVELQKSIEVAVA